MDASSSSLLLSTLPKDFPEFSFLVIKKIIIPELMGALLKFFEIDLCISQLAAIVNAVGPLLPSSPFHWHSLSQHSVLLMFLIDFSTSCPTQTACCMQPPPHLICLCGPVSKSAPENKFMIYRKHMLRSLSIDTPPSHSLSFSVSLPPQELRAYYSVSLVVVSVACCFLSASFVQFPFLRISLYSFPIIIAAITNNRSTWIGT